MSRIIVIAGGHGTVGAACADYLRSQGYTLRILSRRAFPDDQETITWDPVQNFIERNICDGALAVINVTGAGLPEQRWTRTYKRRLVESRTLPARFLGRLIAESSQPPAIYIGMSAIGIYGNSGTQPVSESDILANSNRFVVELVKSWEAEHQAAGEGCRTVLLRCPPVLTLQGGFLPKMIGPTRFGLYPYFGNGEQLLSWIMLSDLARLMHHIIQTEEVKGVFNVAAEEVVSLRRFMHTLRTVSGRPGVFFPVPKILMQMAFGEMAGILFDSCAAATDRLRNTGFRCTSESLDPALHALLNV